MQLPRFWCQGLISSQGLPAAEGGALFWAASVPEPGRVWFEQHAAPVTHTPRQTACGSVAWPRNASLRPAPSSPHYTGINK